LVRKNFQNPGPSQTSISVDLITSLPTVSFDSSIELEADSIPAELSLTVRKIAHFCIGNLICSYYRFLDGN
jgi:hypothetical protein